MTTALSIKDVTKSFGDLTVLHNLSFDVEEGEAVVLLGPSGCGKTTLLKLIAGFLQPNSGSISVAGKVVSTPYEMIPPDRRKMSMVFQSYAIWPHKNVFQNVAYGLEVKKVDKAEIERRVMRALEVVQLDGLEKRYSTELSGGQQQRVALARAIVVEPALLLLDEPLSNLDANLRIEMREELKEVHNRLGISFVYVTHDQAEAMVLGDRIMLLNKGVLVQVGKPEALYEKPVSKFAAQFIGSSNVLSGKPTGKSNGSIQVETSFGNMVLGQQTGVVSASDPEIAFCIRPEWIEMYKDKPAGSEQNLFGAKVTKRVYYGRHIHYTANLNGIDIEIETPFDVKIPEGDDVMLVFPPECCVCLKND
ncbi:MAG: ABC transporter ATP-binding protein [Rhodospirillales bacterium]